MCIRDSIEGYAVFKRAWQLVGKDGNVLERAEHIAKRQADEFYVVLLYELQHLAHGIIQGPHLPVGFDSL